MASTIPISIHSRKPLERMFACAHPSLCSGPPTVSTTLTLRERTLSPETPLRPSITIKKSPVKGGFFNGARCFATIGLKLEQD